MTKFNRILLLGIGLLAISQGASAKEGFYIGSHISNLTLSHTIDRDTGSADTPSITSLSEESGFGFGIDVGYKFNLIDNLTLAAELFYSDQDNQTNNVNNLLRTQLDVNEIYGAKVKLGFDVSGDFSVYALAGTTTVDFDVFNSYPFAPPEREATRDIDEFTFGIGASYAVTDKFSVNAEYTQLNDAGFDPIPEVAVPGKINPNELDLTGLTLGLKYHF